MDEKNNSEMYTSHLNKGLISINLKCERMEDATENWIKQPSDAADSIYELLHVCRRKFRWYVFFYAHDSNEITTTFETYKK